MKTIRDEKTVHDKVRFVAGDNKLVLRVDKSGRKIVSDLNKAKELMAQVTDESMEEDMKTAAMAFASAIFGDEQAKQLFDLYGNPVSVVNVCGQYFGVSLKKKITAAQIR